MAASLTFPGVVPPKLPG